jgi:hypothetical protein
VNVSFLQRCKECMWNSALFLASAVTWINVSYDLYWHVDYAVGLVMCRKI